MGDKVISDSIIANTVISDETTTNKSIITSSEDSILTFKTTLSGTEKSIFMGMNASTGDFRITKQSLSAGNFDETETSTPLVIGNDGALTIKSNSIHNFDLDNGIVNVTFVKTIHKGANDGATADTLSTQNLVRLSNSVTNMLTPGAAGAAITAAQVTNFNKIFGTTLAAEAVKASANGNAATLAQVKELSIAGTANVVANQLDDGAIAANQASFQVYRITGDAAGNDTTVTFPDVTTANAGSAYLFLFANDSVMPDNSGNKTLKFIFPAAIDNNSLDLAINNTVNGYHPRVSTTVDKAATGAKNLTFTPGADDVKGIDNTTGSFGYIAVTVTAAGHYHVLSVRNSNTNLPITLIA